jgi:predicted DNA-binding protein
MAKVINVRIPEEAAKRLELLSANTKRTDQELLYQRDAGEVSGGV